ncbi:hypothetical protein BANRA_05734 [Klebsiella variicola]|nr:hypothetical protein BANRA_05734 [Klebsiella variicola]
MHRKHRFGRVAAGGQISRGETRVPVMGVDDFRTPERVKTTGKLGPDPAQQRETQDVIRIILHLLVMIRITRPVIEMRGINQIDAHTVKMAKQQRHPPGECLPAGHHLRILNPVADRRKPRQQHAGIQPLGNLRRRERAGDVGQSARFNSGNISALHVKLACMLLIIQPQRRPATGQYFLCRRTRFFRKWAHTSSLSSISLVTRTMPSSER